MKYKVLAVIVLVVGSLPMAMAYTAPAQTPASSDDGSAVGVQQLTAGAATDIENSSGTTTEYTKLYIDTEITTRSSIPEIVIRSPSRCRTVRTLQ